MAAADLRVAQGQVRCGRCLSIFNALATLYDDLPGHKPPAGPQAAAAGAADFVRTEDKAPIADEPPQEEAISIADINTEDGVDLDVGIAIAISADETPPVEPAVGNETVASLETTVIAPIDAIEVMSAAANDPFVEAPQAANDASVDEVKSRISSVPVPNSAR